MAGHQTEAELERQLIKRLQKNGYHYVEIKDGAELEAHFRDVLNQRNSENLKGQPLSNREFEAVMNQLIGAKSLYEIAQQLRGSDIQAHGKIEIQRDDNSSLYLQVFDGETAANNLFEVTHQVTLKGKYENRYDVLILVNGMPLTQIELKQHGIDMRSAFNQIIRYRNETQQFNRLFKLLQFFVISNGVETRYFANGDQELNYNFTFYWTDRKNEWLNDLDQFADSFFNLSRYHSLIAKYTIFDSRNRSILVMRPYQIYATEAIIERAAEQDNQNGYVWHTTGSGKTITSFKTSRLLTKLTDAEKVIFLIDRNDLDIQTSKNFRAFLPQNDNGDTGLDQTTDTRILVEQLNSNKWPLIVTTIQKLNHAVQNDRYKKILAPYQSKRVVFIEDEAHRSQFGLMRKNVNNWFKNAQHFGFTGTPIFTENVGVDGRTTADMYGKELHRYLIKDAIRDHNVLPFTVQYINTIRGKQIEDGGDEQVEAINTQEVLQHPDRLRLIVQHILLNHRHYTSDKTYNAILTVPNTRVALEYYKLFKEQNAIADEKNRLNVTTIFTWAANESDNEEHQSEDDLTSRQGLEVVIKDYNKKYHQNFSTEDFKAYFANVSQRMSQYDVRQPDENIDVLIVVNMFLTGFDSPKLSTLYVDKKLRYHSLLQAYSRTNRIEKEAKQSGNIVAYRNLKEATDAAVTLFSAGAADEFFAASFESLDKDFREAIAGLREVAAEPSEVDNLYNLGVEELRKFVNAFKNLARIYNKLNVYDDFKWSLYSDTLTEQDYEDYKGKYFAAYRHVRGGGGDPASVIEEIDFELSLFTTDRIDVEYIVNLIKNIDLQDPTTRRQQIDKIGKLLQTQGEAITHSKAELLRRFLEEVVATLAPDADIQTAMNTFMEESLKAALDGYSRETSLSVPTVEEQLHDYAFYGNIDTRKIYELPEVKNMSFKQKIALRKSIEKFAKETVDNFINY